MSKPTSNHRTTKRAKKDTELDRTVTVTVEFDVYGDQHHVAQTIKRIANILSVELHKSVTITNYNFTNGQSRVVVDPNGNGMEVPN